MRKALLLLVFICIFGCVGRPGNAQTRWLVDKIVAGLFFEPMSVAAADSNDLVMSVDIFGMAYILRTQNGGTTWDTIFHPSTHNFGIYEIAHPTPNLIIAALDSTREVGPATWASGGLIRSSDGGKTWQYRAFGSLEADRLHRIERLKMYDSLNCIVFVTGDPIYKTSDGGLSWYPINVADSVVWYARSMSSPDPSTIVYTAYDRTASGQYIWKTSNGGASWERGSSVLPYSLFSIEMLGADTGFAVGFSWTTMAASLLKTADGGMNWTSIFDTVNGMGNEQITAVRFSDRLHGIVTGRNGFMLSTSDGGLTWRRDSIDISLAVDIGAFRAICFSDPTHGIMAGSGGTYATLQPKALLPRPQILYPDRLNPAPRSFKAMWTDVPGVSLYEVKLVSNNGKYETLEHDSTVATNSYQLNGLTANSYFLYVRAKSDDNRSNWHKVLFGISDDASVDPSSQSGNSLAVFPNPSRGERLSFSTTLRGVGSMRILTISGAEILRAPVTLVEDIAVVPIQRLTQGSYMIEVACGDRIESAVFQVLR